MRVDLSLTHRALMSGGLDSWLGSLQLVPSIKTSFPTDVDISDEKPLASAKAQAQVDAVASTGRRRLKGRWPDPLQNHSSWPRTQTLFSAEEEFLRTTCRW